MAQTQNKVVLSCPTGPCAGEGVVGVADVVVIVRRALSASAGPAEVGEVEVSLTSVNGHVHPSASRTQDPNGELRVAFAGVKQGWHRVSCVRTSGGKTVATATKNVQVVKIKGKGVDAPQQVLLTLSKDDVHALIVHVLDSKGRPIEGAVVKISGPRAAQAVTGNDGIARFGPLPDGTYSVIAVVSGTDEDPRVVHLTQSTPGTGGGSGSKLGITKEAEAPTTATKQGGTTTEVVITALPNYWEYPTLNIPEIGPSDPPLGTPLLKRFIRQIKNDLRNTKFLDFNTTDDELRGLDFLLGVRRFRRAASRIFRVHMDETPGTIDRKAGQGFDVKAADTLKLPIVGGRIAAADAQIDGAFATELHDKWVLKGLVRPLGRFKATQCDHDPAMNDDEAKKNGTKPPAPFAPPPFRDPARLVAGLRADITPLWNKICSEVDAAGGILRGPYGETGVRPLTVVKVDAEGNNVSSPRSRHFFGLAVDIRQHFNDPGWARQFCDPGRCWQGRTVGGKKIASFEEAENLLKNSHRRYFVEALDAMGTAITSTVAFGAVDTFWRIWCRVDEPSAESRVLDKSSPEKFTLLNDFTFHDFPAGHYIDLSAIIERDGHFTRIQAHPGFMAKPVPLDHTEWWHFSACIDDELPFSARRPFKYGRNATVYDMATLFGVSESFLRSHNITDVMMEQTTA